MITKPIKGGSKVTVQGLPCHIPPVGYVYNRMTGRIERRSVLSRSPNKKAQYWERRGLPAGYETKRKEEARIQQFNPTHIDVSLEEFRRDAWDKRLNGMWFYNNGEPVYITGLHYYYLEWIYIGGATNNGGYPDFWDSDRKFFYFLQYVIEDPECFGMVYVTRRREGKALAIDTDIPTPDGFRKLADIKEGDYVFDANGDPTLVTFATDVMYGHDCYKVTFDDGASVIADAEHRWWVSNKAGRRSKRKDRSGKAWHVETTEQMFNSPIKVQKENNFQIPINGVVKFKNKELPIDPYVLGIWLGDGNCSGSKITTVDKEIEDYLSSIYEVGHKTKGISTYYKANKKTGIPFRTELVSLNLLKNKHIPEEYMTSSYEQRMELIRGLMDSDGFVEKGNTSRMEFSQKNGKLAYQLKELLASVGIKSKMSISRSTLYGKDCGERYRLRFKTTLPVFKLKRKLERVDNNERNYGWATIRAITNIEKVESVPVKCIQVDNPDHLFLCGRDYIVTHNTSKSVAFLLEGITRNKEANGGIQSKTDDDAEKIVYKSGVLKAFDKLPHFFQPTHNDRAKSKGIRFKPYSDRETDDYLGGWIDYRSSKDTAYDGSKLHRYVGDEVFKTVGCDIRSRHEIVLPCLEDPNGRPYGKCLYTSTVEEMEGRIETYRSFWEESNQKQKDGLTGFTKTKLYRYFLPADDAMDRDKYGYVDKKKNRDFIVAEREQVKDDTKEYFGRMRRKPLSIDEAFRASADSSVYDTIKLQDRFESISWREDLYVQGNFIWKNGEKDTEVIFERSKNGKWKVIWDFIPDSSLIRPHQTRPKPWNNARYAMGCDPYSHSRTVDYRNSAGAFYVYRKHDISEPLKSETFVAQYIARPSSSDLFFEDVIKTCIFFGCEVLIEDNRNNILDYFKYRQYERFAMRLPGRKMPGIPGSTKTHGDIIAFTEAFIYNHLDKVYFKELLDDWINFDPFNTTKFDAAMAAGYTLIANNKYRILLQKKADERMLDIDILFGKN